MKYGDTLQQRSIAAWHTHNIDYKDIKHFIKTNTTPGKGKAVAIPGQADTNAQEFENRLFLILKEQDERITWFVKSKVGEIQRRLAHLEQQIERFVVRVSSSVGHRTTVKRLERYSKIESDILKVGEEIQSLSRFIGVQQEAFRKLIKKYKKWTGSVELGYRFDSEVRHKGSSFTDAELKPLLQRYEELLHAVRTLFEHGKSDSRPNQIPPSSSPHFKHACFVLEQGKRVDFDELHGTMGSDQSGQDAVYWVHPENEVELHILLQTYTRSFNALCRQPSIASGMCTPTSPRNDFSFSSSDTFDIIADDAKRYLVARSSENVASLRSRSQKAALHARGVLNDEVSLLSWIEDSEAASATLKTCAVKRKCVSSVLDPNCKVLSRKASIARLSSEESPQAPEESLEELQKWLKRHSDISPIAAVTSKRARFFHISKDSTGIITAALDQAVQFQSGVSTEADASTVDFPYAVLSVRQEGVQDVDLVRVLDNSHLLERVHGFSLEYHAIWQAKQPEDVSPPFWIPLLKQDLRKLPQTARKASRKESAEFGSQSTTPRVSTATSSDAGGQPDRTKTEDIGKLKFASISEVPSTQSPRRLLKRAPTTERYWNEYDDPSDDEDHYVIYVDPNHESIYYKAWKSFKQAIGGKEKMDPERQALLYSPDLESGTPEEAESSDDELEPPIHRISRSYGDAADAGLLQVKMVETFDSVPRLTMTCFASSLALLVVACILAATGRKRLHKEVDAGIIFAVATSLTFAITGVASLYRSGPRRSTLMWVLAVSTLCLIGIASGGLLAWMFA